MDAIKWAFEQLVLLLSQHDSIAALAIGLIAAATAAEFFAHMLPPATDAFYAQRAVRLFALAVGLCLTWSMAPTRRGFALACVAGFGGQILRWAVTRALYARWPALEPKATQPNGPCP